MEIPAAVGPVWGCAGINTVGDIIIIKTMRILSVLFDFFTSPRKSQARKTPPRTREVIFRLAAAWIIAVLLVGTYRIISWPRPPLYTWLLVLAPPPEVLLLFGLFAYLRITCTRGLRWIALSLLFGLLIAWNIGEVVYRWNFRGHFILWDDFKFLPGLLGMVTRIDWFRRAAGTAVLYILVLIAALTLGALLLRIVTEASRTASRAAGIAALAAAVLQSVFFFSETPSVLILRSMLAAPLESAALSDPPITQKITPKEAPEEASEEAGSAFDSLERTLLQAYPGIGDGDIHLLIIESYGHTLFTNPVHREKIAPVYQSVAGRLKVAGWNARSGFLHSPAYGGRSWLADTTLITGRRIANQRLYDEHIYTGEPHLVGQMAAAGYHTVFAAPGTRTTPKEWADYYGYDDYIIEGDFGYKGPFISFGRISDQFLLHVAGRRFTNLDSPLFLTAQLVSSHVPFERIPVYIDDWSRLGDGSLYHTEGIREFSNNWLTGSEYPEGYIASIEYVFESILGYIERYVDEQSLIILVGDHQPRVPISERTATYGVPLHFLSRAPDALDPLPAELFSAGFIPADTLPLVPMENFPDLLNLLLKPAGPLARYMR